jgi:hypothetical protein
MPCLTLHPSCCIDVGMCLHFRVLVEDVRELCHLVGHGVALSAPSSTLFVCVFGSAVAVWQLGTPLLRVLATHRLLRVANKACNRLPACFGLQAAAVWRLSTALFWGAWVSVT